MRTKIICDTGDKYIIKCCSDYLFVPKTKAKDTKYIEYLWANGGPRVNVEALIISHYQVHEIHSELEDWIAREKANGIFDQ